MAFKMIGVYCCKRYRHTQEVEDDKELKTLFCNTCKDRVLHRFLLFRCKKV